MKTKLKIISVTIAIVVLAILAISKWGFPMFVSKFVTMEASYVEYPVETMMTEADAIFLGRVAKVSETSWNQENGRYWEEGLPYHDLTFAVIQSIAGDVKDNVSLTVIGNAPLDTDAVLESDHTLQIGDEVIVFARNTEFTWREPERVPAVMFMGSPETSVLTKEDDGLYLSINGDVYSLDDFIEQVNQKRVDQ
ncbi:MAG: hypothetical protein M5U34_06525 [Chloroflexi bacterium]|nr:hypothetical protein [Chloroflexota bacterium]